MSYYEFQDPQLDDDCEEDLDWPDSEEVEEEEWPVIGQYYTPERREVD